MGRSPQSYAERSYVPPHKRYVVTVKLYGKLTPFPEPKTKLQAQRLATSLRKEGYKPKIKKMGIPRWKNDLSPIKLKGLSKRYGYPKGR